MPNSSFSQSHINLKKFYDKFQIFTTIFASKKSSRRIISMLKSHFTRNENNFDDVNDCLGYTLTEGAASSCEGFFRNVDRWLEK